MNTRNANKYNPNYCTDFNSKFNVTNLSQLSQQKKTFYQCGSGKVFLMMEQCFTNNGKTD